MSRRHGLHLYQADGLLVADIAAFAKVGLDRGDLTILNPSRQHRAALLAALGGLGIDVDARIAAGRLVVGDADTLAARSIATGSVDAIWDELLAAIERGGRVATIWGETPDRLLDAGHPELYRDLERRWCDAVATMPGLDLVCSYAADPLDARIYGGELQTACYLHTHVHAIETAADLDRRVTGALNDILGSPLTGMALSLADAADRPTQAMPAALARLLWLYEHMPSTWRRVLNGARASGAAAT